MTTTWTAPGVRQRASDLLTERDALQTEVDRLRKQLRIAVDGLGTIADRGGEDWQSADRALTRMREVES